MTEASFSSRFAIDTERYTLTHRAAGELGEVMLLGHCLATQAEFELAANLALQNNDPQPLSNLAGNYSIVMDYGKEQVLATDPAGKFRFYYKSGPESIQIADSGRKLGDTPDEAYLGSYILSFTELVEGRTGLQGVQRLGGNQTARITRGQLTSLTETNTPSESYVSAEDAFDNLRQAIIEAIKRRAAPAYILTSDLSGGYDSTTLAYLAAGLLPGGIDTLTTYTPCLPAGDLYFARRVAETNPNIRLHIRREEPRTLPFTDMLRPTAMHDSPYPQITNGVWIEDYMAWIRNLGGNLHMTGAGGDDIFASSSHMTRLAQAGDLKGLREVAQAKGRLASTDPQQMYDKAMHDAAQTPADDLRSLARLLRQPENLRQYAQPSRYTWYRLPEEHIPLLAPPMRRHLSELAEELADSQTRDKISSLPRMAHLQPSGDSQYCLQQYSQAFGVNLHAPYLDRQVIEASLQTSRVRSVPGIFKYPLQRALGDLLPDVLLSRNSKSAYDGMYYRGLRTNWDDIINLFTKNSRLAARGIIDPKQVIEALHVLDSGQQGTLSGVRQVVSAEVWLRLLEQSDGGSSSRNG